MLTKEMRKAGAEVIRKFLDVDPDRWTDAELEALAEKVFGEMRSARYEILPKDLP